MATLYYAPLLRPASGATLPAGLVWDYFQVPAEIAHRRLDLPVSSHRYGVIKTDRPLTSAEIWRFDLKPLEFG